VLAAFGLVLSLFGEAFQPAALAHDHSFERVAGLDLDPGYAIVGPGVLDPDGEFAYVVVNTSPHSRLVEVELETFTIVSALELPGEWYVSALMDPAGAFAYVTSLGGEVERIDLATFTHTDTLLLPRFWDPVFEKESLLVYSGLIDPEGEFAYFGTGTAPGRILKVDLASFEHVGTVTLPFTPEVRLSWLETAAMHPSGEAAYFYAHGGVLTTNHVVKIDLTTFDHVATLALPFNHYVAYWLLDPGGGTGWAGNHDTLVELDLDSFTTVGDPIALDLDTHVGSAAVMDPAGEFAYLATSTFELNGPSAPQRVYRIDMTTLTVVDTLVLAPGDGPLHLALMDQEGAWLYLGTTDSSPARFIKVGIGADVGHPPWSPPSCEGVERLPFPDVPASNVHHDRIGCAAGLGLVTGFPDGTFGPERRITRAQLASILARALRESGVQLPVGEAVFVDVTDGPHAANINALAAAGVINGRTPTTFEPEAPVQRGQMMTMLVRAGDRYPPAFPDAPAVPPFSDIVGGTHEHSIARAHTIGIAQGRADGTFDPSGTVRLDQAASFLTRWLDWRAGGTW
jgi:hypothetical protein